MKTYRHTHADTHIHTPTYRHSQTHIHIHTDTHKYMYILQSWYPLCGSLTSEGKDIKNGKKQ